MYLTQSCLTVCVLVLTMALLSTHSFAKSSVEGRLEQLEKKFESQFSVHLLNELDTLNQEVLELRGQIEEYQHQLELLHKCHEQRYVDFDNRLSHLFKIQIKKTVTTNIAPAVDSFSIPKPLTSKKEQQLYNPQKEKLSEQSVYEIAYQFIEQKRYQDALIAFQDFLWQFPKGQYSPNAHYWIGEIYLTQWQIDKTNQLNLDKAISSFKTITSCYAKHHKAIDSLLKLGLIEIDKENWTAAKNYLTQLIHEHPNSSRTRIAEARIQQLKEQGLTE